MPDVLASASVVVARSGANTVWECAAAGKPMILVPLEKGSSRGDQVENARFFVGAGAAVMMTGLEATSDHLAKSSIELLDNERLFSDMSSASLALGTSRPARLIAELILDKMQTRGEAK
jgi:UDP-N-acetylglucosamine--N-acetylmuramyl-(pentapeptide) pyrophosphoryl-undecaprenol N-acetylglucosamine transferase